MKPVKICFFLATSGHSGVDRAMANLITEIVSRGYRVDQLKVRKHGPHLDIQSENFRIIDLGTSHTYTALPALVRYLRRERPSVMLSDKDRVNRTALLAKLVARTDTRVVLRSGTTLSVDLASRGRLERWIQRHSIRYLYPSAYNVIVPSQGAADDMTAFSGLPRNHIQVVHTPIIPDRLLTRTPEAPDHPWFQDQSPIILSAGELGSRKDFPTLLRAFAELRSRRNCRLIILGRGKQHTRLLSLAR
ncbi:MAG: glycosyltransferase, partial [Gammaproteobacteria bacterium]|nr:glycosyltransferase [Gammaproteobacteria bacterium]